MLTDAEHLALLDAHQREIEAHIKDLEMQDEEGRRFPLLDSWERAGKVIHEALAGEQP